MLFALLLPVILILSVIVVDVANWYVHSRRLQTMVDAGAFAGATKFVGCSFQFGDPDSANEGIGAMALNYSGDTERDPTTKNLQVQEPNDVRVVLNSARYWADGDPMDGVGLDNTLDLDNNPATAGDPCSSKTLDVKATDDDAPLRLPAVRRRSEEEGKVEILQVKEQNGMLPWAVPDIEPAAVAAIFVDENDGVVKTPPQPLCNVTAVSCAGLPTPDSKLSYWVTPAFEDLVDIVGENTGVVILVSKIDDTPMLTTGAGALTAMCTQSPGLVRLRRRRKPGQPPFIHGWSQLPGGTPVQPQIRDVWVLDLTCGDDLSAPYFLRAGDCDLGAEAVIDFGVGGDPGRGPAQGGISAEVRLTAPGCGGQGCRMDYEGPAPSGDPNESLWRTSSNATLATDFGRSTFSIRWETEVAGHGHSGTFGGVAHPYVADEVGPVDYLELDNQRARRDRRKLTKQRPRQERHRHRRLPEAFAD